MPTAVPAVERASAILTFLASRRQTTFALAEIAAATGIHRATCYSTLLSLVSSGAVHRDEAGKRYSLGPGLIALGSAACGRFPQFEEARIEMFALARELDLAAFICVAMGDEMVVLDRVLTLRTADLPIHPGTRFPLMPPFGTIFYAWSPPDVVDAWLGRVAASASPEEIAVYRDAITAIRLRGYSIGSEAETGLGFGQMLDRLVRAGEREDLLEAVLDIAEFLRRVSGATMSPEQGLETRIKNIIAPMFDVDGRVAMTLTLHGIPGDINSQTLSDFAERLQESAQRVMSVSGGRVPGLAGSGVGRR